MLVAVVPSDSGGWRLRELDDSGEPAGPEERVADLPAAVAAREAAGSPRWLWASTGEVYPGLLRAGVRVARCHDAELTEGLLSGQAGRWGEPRGVAAAWARARGLPVPEDRAPRPAAPPGDRQVALFEATAAPAAPAGFDALAGLIEVYRLQRASITGRFRLLVAAESAGALVAAEMGHVGLPWRADIHRALLVDLLGEPSVVGGPPKRLVELSARIAEAFGVRQLHPESPAEVVRAFARVGVQVPNTRAWVLRKVEHPAVPLLLEYKELYRIWTAHGWSWCDAWVRDGRFRPEYVPGGVVSGRWATRGGGALQIPKVVRRAVVADPGWKLVVADAGQLEPRVLAAVSGDRRLAEAGAAGDLYAALAADAFGGDRARAKVALLGAMYGQTGGAAVPALAALRGSYPTAFEYVESAARTGEGGGLVRSWLGRTCPPASAGWRDPVTLEGPPPEEPAGGGRGASERARGRFTRNFVIQATAAEWALTLLAALRRELSGGLTGAPADGSADGSAELVFFVHDEVVVHCPQDLADRVTEAVRSAGEEARRLLFGDTPVRFPLGVTVADCYADAAH